MSKKSPLQLKSDMAEFESRTKESVQRLNDFSNQIRLGKVENYDTVAKYSGGTVTVMFTFLGIILGLSGNISDTSKLAFVASTILFVCCIGLSLVLRQSVKLYAFYLQNNFYLSDRKTLFSIQQDVMRDFPDKVAVISTGESTDEQSVIQERLESTENSIEKLESEIIKSKRKTRTHEMIFKFGGYLIYGLFTLGYVSLAMFIINNIRSL